MPDNAQTTATQTVETATAETTATTTTPTTTAPATEPTALDNLLKLREEFAKAHDATGAALSAVDKQIDSVKAAIWNAKQEEAQKRLTGEDKAVLNGHDIVFLINNTKEAGHGPDSLLGASVAAAHHIHNLVKASGVKDAKVVSRFWGERGTCLMSLDGKFGATGYNTTNVAKATDLLPAAKEVLAENTPDKSLGRPKHYVITGDGAVSGDVASAVAILEAAAKFNPKATFDFIVCNAAGTNVDALVQQWSDNASDQKPNIIKVGKPQEIKGAVLKTLNARLEGRVYAPQAAEVKSAHTTAIVPYKAMRI